VDREDLMVLGGGVGHAVPDVEDLLPGAGHRPLEGGDLFVHLIAADRRADRPREDAVQEESLPDRDPSRGRDSLSTLIFTRPSVTPLLLPEFPCDQLPDRRHGLFRIQPVARIRIFVSFGAASISTPMMLFPLTSIPSFRTWISEANPFARRTNCAAARACRPSRFRTSNSRSTLTATGSAPPR